MMNLDILLNKGKWLHGGLLPYNKIPVKEINNITNKYRSSWSDGITRANSIREALKDSL